jgi:hypothetical protein
MDFVVKFFDYFLPTIIYFIIFIKIVFILMVISHIYIEKISNNQELKDKYSKKTLYWKERTEYIFTISMAILLIFIFHPWSHHVKKYMTPEIKILFYLFGWILIITSNWSLFIHEAPWYKQIVNILK